jgi:hypothetical protein
LIRSDQSRTNRTKSAPDATKNKAVSHGCESARRFGNKPGAPRVHNSTPFTHFFGLTAADESIHIALSKWAIWEL